MLGAARGVVILLPGRSGAGDTDQLLRDRGGVAGPSLWLLMIVLNPFATKLLTAPGHPDLDTHALRFGFYALLQVLESALVFVMLAHILSRGLAPRTPRTTVIDIARQSFNLILGFGLSIPVFFVTTNGWVLWIVVPLVVSRWRHAHRRRRNREAGPGRGNTGHGDTGHGDTGPEGSAPG
jgi:hypothetical protein